MTQPVLKRPIVLQPIQSPSPKFEITGRHIPEQPWSNHANYFAALEDDDDETVAAYNVNEGYLNEANFGMENVIPTKHNETPAHILHTTIPRCDPNCEKREQINKMVKPYFLPNSRWAKNAWQSIVTQQELQELPNAGTIFNTTRLKHAVEYAISDSGATGHFLVQGAPVANLEIAEKPITITLPIGRTIQSTHTCNLDIPWLPNEMTEAHIVPGLAHSSLISTRKFCAAGCQVTFDEEECKVYHKGHLVLVGDRDEETYLWRLPINPTAKPTHDRLAYLDLHMTPKQATNHVAQNVYTIPYKQNQLKFMHQTFFCPPIKTLIQAIHREHLEGIPFMHADLVRKYLVPSQATSKGRMKRPRTGIRSTRNSKTSQSLPIQEDECPPNLTSAPHIIPNDGGANNIFCFAALADKQAGTMHTDTTGALPTISLDGHQYYFIAYNYDSNYIFAEPIKDVKDATLV